MNIIIGNKEIEARPVGDKTTGLDFQPPSASETERQMVLISPMQD